MNVVGLVLIGSARLSRSHTQIKNLLNSYRAGAHCNLITLEVSALYSVEAFILACKGDQMSIDVDVNVDIDLL